jgi:hypothetical protein
VHLLGEREVAQQRAEQLRQGVDRALAAEMLLRARYSPLSVFTRSSASKGTPCFFREAEPGPVSAARRR